MSKDNPGVIFDASSSWNGYNHQGKLAIWFAIQKIEELYNPTITIAENKRVMDTHFLELEYLEDFSLGRIHNGKNEYITVHQVKNHDKTAVSDYESALLGLAYHVNCMTSIQKAYLHTTKQVNLNGKKVDEYIKTLIANPGDLKETLIKINEIRNDQKKRAEVIRPHKGRPSDFISKLKKALWDNNSTAKKLDASNIDEACNYLETEVNKQINLISSMSDELISKIEIFSYDFDNEKKNFCEVNEMEGLLKNEIKKTISLMGLKSYWDSDKNIHKRYVCLLGHLDEHIIDRNLNFLLYKDGMLDRKIKLGQIFEWLVSDEIEAQDEEFYHYYIKQKMFEIADRFCRQCKKTEEECRFCLVTSVLNRIGSLPLDKMRKFLILTNPNNKKGLSMESYPEYTNSNRIADPFLRGVRDISIPFDEEKIAVTYTDVNTLQYVLTTIVLDNMIDDVSSICSDIIENRSLYDLLMDCDCFISRNMEVASISEEAMKVGKGFIENKNNDIESEHIARLKKVKLVNLEKFCEEII